LKSELILRSFPLGFWSKTKMSTRTKITPTSSVPRYVESGVGLRVCFFLAALACVAGLGLRLYFHPERVKSIVEQALGSDAERLGLKFQSARLSLAQGSVPQIAVEVRDIEINPAHECRSEPSVRIARLFLPLDLTRLMRLQISLGTIASEDILVDLDALKTNCSEKAQVSGPNNASTTSTGPLASATDNEKPMAAVDSWWTMEHAESVRRVLEGVEFSRVTVLFEDATKKVYLESLAAEPGTMPGSVRFEANLVIPPELTYGERLPKLKIEATANPAAAEVKVRAALSEGALVVKGHLTAAPGGYLDADLQAAVSDVPVSTLVPLITKSGIIKGAFRPRFMWMNCQAAIRGRFQGLFVENSLTLSACEIEGKRAKIRIDEAVRLPDGTWKPFVVQMSNVDLAQLLDTFDSGLLDGVLSEYGRFDGEMRVKARHVAELSGKVKGAQIRFLSHNERAEQLVSQLHLRANARDGNVSGHLDQIELDRGVFVGHLNFSVTDGGKESSLHAEIKELKFSDDVQKILFGGKIASIKGEFAAKFVGNRLNVGHGQVRLEKLDTKDFRLDEVRVQIETLQSGGQQADAPSPEIRLHAVLPQFAVRRDSLYFQGLGPVFFTHEFTDEWVKVDGMQLRGSMRERIADGFQWTNARASLEGRKIRLTSAGSMNAQREIQGWLNVDFPSVRRLKWQLAGGFAKVELHASSSNLLELQKKGAIDDSRLGLSTRGLLGKKSTRD
jgi:hypothetical protein